MTRYVTIALMMLTACSRFGEEGTSEAGNDAASVPADGAASGDGGTDFDAAGSGKLVFVTKNQRAGSFGGKAADFCNSEGKVQRPAATFVAWFTTDESPFKLLINEGEWRNRSGDLVFASRATIVSGSLMHAIDEHADGSSASDSAWTNVNPDAPLLPRSRRTKPASSSRPRTVASRR